MANRILRDWTQSEIINLISEKAEVFFTRLIMKADDFGCFYGNIKLIRAALYPLRNIPDKDIEKSISECSKAGLIIIYSDNKKDFIKINNFGQRLRIMKSKFPQPNDSNLRTDGSEVPPETKRNEDETKMKRIPPTLIEFLDYCKEIKEYDFQLYEFSLKTKYQSWIERGWKDGNGNEIIIWKTKIRSVMPYLKPSQKQFNPQKIQTNFG